MFQRFVQCPVEPVLGGHSVIGSQHHVHASSRTNVGTPSHSLNITLRVDTCPSTLPRRSANE